MTHTVTLSLFHTIKNELGPGSLGVKYFLLRSVAPPCEKVAFAFERSYITSAVRKSVLEMPSPW